MQDQHKQVQQAKMILLLSKKTDFEKTLKKLNKKFSSDKTKNVEAEQKITDLTNKVAQIKKRI